MNLQQFLKKFISGDMTVIKTMKRGLCYSIINGTTGSVVDFEEHFSTWEHYSGVLIFPIIDMDRYTHSLSNVVNARIQYENGTRDLSLYKGDQLKLRISLAKHVLKELEKKKNVK